MMWVVFLAISVLWAVYYILSYNYFYEMNAISIIFHIIFLCNLLLATITAYKIDKKLEDDEDDRRQENILNSEIESYNNREHKDT